MALKLFAGLLVLVAIGVSVFTKDPYYLNGFAPEKKTMKAIMSTKKGTIELVDVPIPVPKPGQVLVKMKYASVNPSDVYAALGEYKISDKEIKYPHPNGFEGSGHVIGTGGGFLGFVYTHFGTRVGIVTETGSSWAEYAVADVDKSIPLPSTVEDLPGAACFVNPSTVVGFIQVAQDGNHKAMVHTAANSALGLMLLKAAAKYDLVVVAVVRGEKNRKALLEFGHPAELIVRSDIDSFEKDLAKAVKATSASLAFDAVSGELSRKIYKAMPAKSETYVYGLLSGDQPPEELMKQSKAQKSFNGFHIKAWLDAGGLPRLVQSMVKMYSMLPDELSTKFAHVLDIKDKKTLERIYAYKKHQKGGKIALEC